MFERVSVISFALISACNTPATTTPMCPDGGGYVVREVCTCGPTGGCASQTLQCLQICSTASDCSGGRLCLDGTCAYGCL